MEINDIAEGSVKSENDSHYSQILFEESLDTPNAPNGNLSKCMNCATSDSELLLSCLHPICLKCFPKNILPDNTFQCKLCGDPSRENVSWNFNKKNMTESCKFCESIPDSDADLFYCLQCYSVICPSCEVVHNTKLKNHSMLPLNNCFRLCCKHPDKYLEWFCKDCDHTICEDCQLDIEHDDHNVIWALDWVKKCLDGQTLTPLCFYKYSLLEETAGDRLPDAIDVLDKECEIVEREVHSARQAVAQTVKKFIDLMRNYHERINIDLDSYQKKKIRSLQCNKKKLQQTKQKSNTLLSFIKNLSHSVSVKEALSVVNFFTNHSEDIHSDLTLAEDIIQSYIERQTSVDDDSQLGKNSLWREANKLEDIVEQIGAINYRSNNRRFSASNENESSLNFKRGSPFKITPHKTNSKGPSPSKNSLPSIKIKIPKDVPEVVSSSNNSTPAVQSSSSFDEGHSSSNSHEKVNSKKKSSKRKNKSYSKIKKSGVKYSKMSSPQDSCDEFIYSLYKKRITEGDARSQAKQKKNEDERHCLIGSPFTTESVSEPNSPGTINLIAPDHAEDDPHEDYCSVCYDGGELICCSRCVHVYHASCHLPPTEPTNLEDDWVCIMCRELQPLDSHQNQTSSDSLSNIEYLIACRCLMAMYFDKVNSLPFVTSVDPDEATGHHYYSVIKQPISLSTLSSYLADQFYYSKLGAFICDVELMFNNCYKYNGPQSPFGQKATLLKNVFYETLKHYTTYKS